jgi:hypothetical protein
VGIFHPLNQFVIETPLRTDPEPRQIRRRSRRIPACFLSAGRWGGWQPVGRERLGKRKFPAIHASALNKLRTW